MIDEDKIKARIAQIGEIGRGNGIMGFYVEPSGNNIHAYGQNQEVYFARINTEGKVLINYRDAETAIMGNSLRKICVENDIPFSEQTVCCEPERLRLYAEWMRKQIGLLEEAISHIESLKAQNGHQSLFPI